MFEILPARKVFLFQIFPEFLFTSSWRVQSSALDHQNFAEQASFLQGLAGAKEMLRDQFGR